MKQLKIPRTERLPGNQESLVEPCCFILTQLVISEVGTIFAQAKENQDSVVSWKFTGSADFIFEEPADAKEIFQSPNRSIFRAILARLGNVFVDDTYFGAGICEVYFEGEPAFTRRLAIAFSNFKETGYWIKIQTFDR